jgi:cyclophilin family peptidyl-prolyl cis-trans isomerase
VNLPDWRVGGRKKRKKQTGPSARKGKVSALDRRKLSLESLEDRRVLSVTLGTIAGPDPITVAGATTQYDVPSGKDLYVPLVGTDAGDTITYTATSSNSAVSVQVLTGDPTLTINVSGVTANDVQFSGAMTFQLFENVAPATIAGIEKLVEDGIFNTEGTFYRAVTSTGFQIIQGGILPPQSTNTQQATLPNEFNVAAAFNSPGLLAMANAGNAATSSPTTGLSTASSEFFVTAPNIPLSQEPQSLNYGYTIFGQLTSGANILSDIENAPTPSGSQYLTNQVTITSATVTTTPSTSVAASQYGVLQISEANNFTGNSTITVTAHGSDASTSTPQTFTVSAAPPTMSSGTGGPLILAPASNLTTSVGTATTLSLAGTDEAGAKPTFTVTQAFTPGTANAFATAPGNNLNIAVTPGTTTVGTSSASGSASVTLTPAANWVGDFDLVAHVDDTSIQFPVHDAQPLTLSVPGQADLEVTTTDNAGGSSITPSVGNIVAGQPITYTVTVSNKGTTNVTGASLVDTLPSAISGATYTITPSSGATDLGFGGSETTASGVTTISDSNLSLAAGSTVTFVITATVKPSATGTLSNSAVVAPPSGVTLTNTTGITASDSDTITPPPVITLKGNGQTITDGSTTPSATNDTTFGTVPVGGTPLNETYTITNTGTAALTLGTVSITGTNSGDFKVTTQPATSVAAGGSTTFTVQFNPTAGGTRAATLNFAENDPTTTSPFTFAVSGVATTQSKIAVTGGGQSISDGSTTPSATNDTTFGTTPVGGTPLSQTYTITNSGTGALALGTVSITGTNAADFTVTTQPATSVAVGGTTTFTVKFAPTASGTRAGTVTFTEDDPTATSPFTFAVSGVATAPSIAVTGAGNSISDGSTAPSATNDTLFGSTQVGGTPLSQTYTITNSGTGALTLGTVSIGGTNSGDFKVTTQPAASVAAGGNTTFTVEFTPTASGTRAGTVSFTENDKTTTSPFTFAVSGVGTSPVIAVTGNSQPITDGSTTPSATNDTLFGSNQVGGTPLSQTYTITNSGTAALTLGTVSIGGTNSGDFKVTTQPSTSVAAGTTTTFTVQFVPTAAGTRAATVNFSENDTTTVSPFTFAVSGIGTAPVIAVTGAGQPITDGTTTTGTANDTAFGAAELGGSPTSETYTITNNGTAALTVGTVSISGTNSGDFAVTTQPATSVAVGGSTTFTVQFTPTAGGFRKATVGFDEDDTTTTSPFTFAVSGDATTQARIGVTGGGQTITDGATTTSATNDTALGTTTVGGTPVSQTYTISNSGTQALALGAVSITGTNASDFTVTTQPATSVAVGGSTTFTVQFSPTAGGTRTATVNFDESDSTVASPFTFAVSGTVPAPVIAVTGNSQSIGDGSATPSTTNDTAFGSTTVGGTPISQTYTITNSGTAALTLGTVSITGTNASDFTVTSQPATSVAAGSSTTFIVQFAPTALGTRTATVSFTENDSTTTSPFTFAISGVVPAPVIAVTGNSQSISDGSATPSTTNDTAFGSTAVGGTPISQTYTVTNSGTAALTLGTVTITGTNASDFTVTTPPATSVAAGSSTTFIVQFAPTASGTRTATVSFSENDTTKTSPFTFAVSGTVTVPTIAVTGNSQSITDGSTTPSTTNDTAFGSTAMGSTISQTYTITNSGAATLTLGTVTIAGTNTSDFTVTTPPATSLAAGGVTTFTVQFAPTAVGTRTATISFAENDTTTASPFTFAVNGVATAATGSLSGTAYNDGNKNGTFDSGEAVLANVIITLTGTDSNNNAVSKTTTTSSNGTYSFSNLVAGTYSLAATMPSDLTPGKATVTNGNGTPSGEGISGITLASGVSATGYNFSADGLAPSFIISNPKFININLFLASSPTLSQILSEQPVVNPSGTTNTFTSGGSAVVVDAGVTVGSSEADLTGATMTISSATLQTGDTLNFTSQNGITGSYAGGVLTLSGSATPAQYQSALQSVTFSTTSTSTTARAISVVAVANSLDSDPASETVDVTVSAPVVTPSGTTNTFTVGGSAVAVDSGVKVSSSSTDLTGATVAISSGTLQSGDTLGFSTQNGIAGSYSSGTMTLSGSATPAQYQTALQTVTFSTTSSSPVTRSVAIVAVNNTLTSNSAAESVKVIAAPVVTPSGTTNTYTTNGSAVPVDSTVTVSSNDTDLTGAKVTISSGTLQSSDMLNFVNQAGITGTYTAGVLTLTGSATPAQYQAALQSVTFSTTSTNTTTRSLSIVAVDNALTSNSAPESVAVALGSSAAISPAASQAAVDAALASEDNWT